ncbi:MAG: hypothetical protein NTY02_03905 [Acidobacteria bacterium]|nr:hypothetical protein [Acidobacteriota bacterium]
MRIVLRNTGGVVDAIVQVVPTTWSSTHVRAGDVVFRDGHADENGNIRGTFITVPPEGQCPQLPAAFAPAELVVNSESGTLAITMQLKVLVASECRWMDGPLRRTTTWRRVPGLGD